MQTPSSSTVGTVGRVVTITADDTTGALETAAACADAGHEARTVHHAGRLERSGRADGADGVLVVDLRSRHLAPEPAAARLRDVVARTGTTTAHKIDSTLRGNWPVEVATLGSLGRQVLLVPAFPRAGRTCVGGVVLVDGVPVHETAFGRDPRRAVRSSRPADHLVDAAVPAAGVVQVADAVGARTAFDAGVSVVIGDASSDDDIASYAALARTRPDVVIVGPAAVVAAAAGEAAMRVPRAHPTGSRAIVVSASRHPAALAQVAGVRARGIEVVEPPADARVDDADRVLARLAHEAHRSLADDPRIDVLFVIGGDTAAAVIGEAEVVVDGTLDVGVAHGEVVLADRRLRLITKPGGFGSADTVTDVLDQVLR